MVSVKKITDARIGYHFFDIISDQDSKEEVRLRFCYGNFSYIKNLASGKIAMQPQYPGKLKSEFSEETNKFSFNLRQRIGKISELLILVSVNADEYICHAKSIKQAV
jgi:hypothetical protein